METTIKQIKRLFLLLCLITAGAQSVWAWKNYHVETLDNIQINGVTYQLCHVYTRMASIYPYYFGGGYQEDQTNLSEDYYASIVGITGSGAIVIPDTIVDGGMKYCVFEPSKKLRAEKKHILGSFMVQVHLLPFVTIIE